MIVAQGGSTSWPCSGGKLAMEDVLTNEAIVIPAYVSEPAKAFLREGGEHV